jgi:hypothetical protein
MPAQNWTTPDQFDFLTERFPQYVDAQSSGRLDKFWAPLYIKWFQHWPEPQPTVNPELVTSEKPLEILQHGALAEAIVKRKKVSCSIQILLRFGELMYFHSN